MMGQQSGLQERLFYEFRLDEWVPVDHLLRKIDAVLDLRGLRRELTRFYSHTGRPSVDPELMIRMLLVGYCYGLRSERRLCEETHLNLAYRWFCRLGLEGAVPDHSTFSKNRHGRFRESALFRRLFEEVVVRCMRAGLVGGEGFAIDASVIEADASSGRKVDGKLTVWPDRSSPGQCENTSRRLIRQRPRRQRSRMPITICRPATRPPRQRSHRSPIRPRRGPTKDSGRSDLLMVPIT